MGCDGGTIPKRDELVKTRKKPEQKDKVADLAFKWRNCALSQEELVQPITACELGRLYNKEAVLEFLIDRSKFECAASFQHLRGLTDIKQLNLTENPSAANKASYVKKGDSYIDMNAGHFICPVAGVEMNGVSRFCFLWTCGCALSERCMKEIKSCNCHKCGKAYTESDVVVLNATGDCLTDNQYRMDFRRAQARLVKRAKKNGKWTSTMSPGLTTQIVEDSDKKSCTELTMQQSTTHGQKSKIVNTTGEEKPKCRNKGGNSVKRSSKGINSIQDNPNASKTYKSLFNTCEAARNQTQGHWVTYNPQYFH